MITAQISESYVQRSSSFTTIYTYPRTGEVIESAGTVERWTHFLPSFGIPSVSLREMKMDKVKWK